MTRKQDEEKTWTNSLTYFVFFFQIIWIIFFFNNLIFTKKFFDNFLNLYWIFYTTDYSSHSFIISLGLGGIFYPIIYSNLCYTDWFFPQQRKSKIRLLIFTDFLLELTGFSSKFIVHFKENIVDNVFSWFLLINLLVFYKKF